MWHCLLSRHSILSWSEDLTIFIFFSLVLMYYSQIKAFRYKLIWQFSFVIEKIINLSL